MKAKQVRAVPQEEPVLHCCVCNKPMSAPYGRWKDADDGRSGSCSKKCELIKEKQHHEMQLLQS